VKRLDPPRPGRTGNLTAAAVVKFTLDSDGRLAIPDGPGLGISLDRDALARYRLSASEFFSER